MQLHWHLRRKSAELIEQLFLMRADGYCVLLEEAQNSVLKTDAWCSNAVLITEVEPQFTANFCLMVCGSFSYDLVSRIVWMWLRMYCLIVFLLNFPNIFSTEV